MDHVAQMLLLDRIPMGKGALGSWQLFLRKGNHQSTLS